MVHIYSLYIQQTRWISLFKLTSHRVNDGGVRTPSSSPFSEMLTAPWQVLQCLVSLLWHIPQDNPHRRCQLQLVTLQEALDRLLEIKGKSSFYIAPISLEKTHSQINLFCITFETDMSLILTSVCYCHFISLKKSKHAWWSLTAMCWIIILQSCDISSLHAWYMTCHQQPCDISPTVTWYIINSHVMYHQQSCDISSTVMWHIITTYLMIINSHVTAGSIDGRSTVQVRICQLLDGALQQSVRLDNITLYAMSLGFISDSDAQQRKQSMLLLHYIQVGNF